MAESFAVCWKVCNFAPDLPLMAYQGVLARVGWLRLYPSEPDAGNADVGMDKYSDTPFFTPYYII